MPVLIQTEYDPPFPFRNRHVNTMFPTLFRRVTDIAYQRERLELPDGDFLHLDWLSSGNRSLAILVHGLEGSSRGQYMKGMGKAFQRAGWDTLAFNLRGCSGEPNSSLRFYHAGATDDLHQVLTHVDRMGRYDSLVLVGFSLGGNLILKYLGDGVYPLFPALKAAVTVSVPVDLSVSAREIDKRHNFIYSKRFLRKLHRKIREKMKLLPGQIDDAGYKRIRTLGEFDSRYTAPIHGFRSAQDYWSRCSCGPFLSRIRIPTLLIQAEDDPFLGPGCFPVKDAEENEFLYLLITRYGGHCGFVEFQRDGFYWSERKALEFARQWTDE